MRAQALALAEAMGLSVRMQDLVARWPWSRIPARFWPDPIAVAGMQVASETLAIGCGGKAAAVLAAWRGDGRGEERRVVQIENPRMDLRRFDLVVAARHDGLVGSNVITTRTALHRSNAARLAEARALWAPRLAHLPRPLVAVLVGGANGRFRFGPAEAAGLTGLLAGMMRHDKVGLAVTPSRRTGARMRAILAEGLAPLGAYVWDMSGDNPYFGLLACADAIVVTEDSVAMVSEAVATDVPVLLVGLPGRSRRIRAFTRGLQADGRIRPFAGRLELWPTRRLDDTQEAADEVRRRLGV